MIWLAETILPTYHCWDVLDKRRSCAITRPEAHKMNAINTSSFLRNANNSAESTIQECFLNDSDAVKTLRITCYAALIVASLVGNLLVLGVVYRYRKMRTNINLLISNMAAADVLVTTVYMPRLAVMYAIGAQWIRGTLGLVLCKIIPFLHGASLLVSILTLLLVAIERLCAVRFPLRRNFDSKRTKIGIALIWLIATVARVPYFLALRITVEPNGRAYCVSKLKAFFGVEEARDIYYTSLMATFYATPLVMIVVSYSLVATELRKSIAPGLPSTNNASERRLKARQNAVRMTIAITAAFVVCWFTYFLAQIASDRVPCPLRFWRLFLAHSNSAINPCIYAYCNGEFRKGFRGLTASLLGLRRKEYAVSNGPGVNETGSNTEARRKTRQRSIHENEQFPMETITNAGKWMTGQTAQTLKKEPRKKEEEQGSNLNTWTAEYDRLYGEAPPERGVFFTIEVYIKKV